MDLPFEIQERLKNIYFEIGKTKMTQIQNDLTKKYKFESGKSQSLISGKDDAMLYAISRMPATFSVDFSLIDELINQGFVEPNLKTIADFGSGTGAGYFSLRSLFENAEISLFERDKNMIFMFKKLTDGCVNVFNFDMVSSPFEGLNFDMVFSSYVLSEMVEGDRINVFKKLLCSAKKYLLIVDTGTPQTYKDYLKLKPIAENLGFKLTAPCMCDKCDLKDDYCQFFARVQRSSAMIQTKHGKNPFEDEKYFYMLFERIDVLKVDKKPAGWFRVIRRPNIKENMVELAVCSAEGTKTLNFTKKNKELFKIAKKIKINQIFEYKNN